MPVPDYETMQRDLAEAMGWTRLYESRRLGRKLRWWGLRPGQERGASILAPDPLNLAEDAEALVDWLEGQGYDVGLYACWVLDRDEDGPLEDEDGNPLGTGRREASCSVFGRLDDRAEFYDEWSATVNATDEPDAARRRRRALCEAAWQAVQRARS